MSSLSLARAGKPGTAETAAKHRLWQAQAIGDGQFTAREISLLGDSNDLLSKEDALEASVLTTV